MGLAAGAALIGARRVPLVLLAGCAALAVEGYATLVHSGGAINDVLPAYLAVALLAGLALGRGSAGGPPAVSGRARPRPVGLPAGQLPPVPAIPASADRAVGERLIAGMRALGGTVAVPADPGLSLLAGMAPTAHQDAAYDVLRATDPAAIASFTRSAAAAVAARRFSAIITDGPGLPLGYPPWLCRYYQRVPAAAARRRPGRAVPPGRGSRRPAPPCVWLPGRRFLRRRRQRSSTEPQGSLVKSRA